MNTAVIPYDQQERMALSLVKSRMFGLENVEQALALMSIAQAEGRHPAIIARDFHIIKGRPSKKAEAMMRDFMESGGKVQWHELSDAVADATFSHPQGGTVRIGWDLERAKQAGLIANDNWRKYPRAMLRSRCVSEGVRTVCPLATSGVYTPEEVVDIVIDETPPGGPINVTPSKPEPVAMVSADQVADHLAAIAAASDVESLKTAYRTAYSEAKRAGDIGAMEQFNDAKDARKAQLEGEA